MRGELGEVVEVGVESKCKRRSGWGGGGGGAVGRQCGGG